MKTPGPQNPGIYRTNRKRKKKSLLPLGGLLLGSWLLSSLLLRGHIGYLLRSISDPMNDVGDGSQMHSSKRSASSSVGRFCDGNPEPHHLQTVFILEQDHFCQWISRDALTPTVKRSSSAWPHLRTAVGGVQGRRLETRRPLSRRPSIQLHA